MQFNSFTLGIEDRVAHLQLHTRRQYNFLTAEFWAEFPVALDMLDRDGTARVLVLSAEGQHFCAGMDLAGLQGRILPPEAGETGRFSEELRRLVLHLQQIVTRLEQLRMPVISAVQGGCVGAGLGLICATDIRYCTADAFFTVQETNVGMTADLGTLQRLPRLIPDGMARELAYTGTQLLSDQARACGLVNHVFADADEMIEEVLDVAEMIATQSPLVVHGCKEMFNYARDHTVADSLTYMATWQSAMLRPADMKEANEAKANKRFPDFKPLNPITKPFG